MSRSIFRYEVAVDDQAHPIATTSPPLHIAARRSEFVEFWAEHDTDADPVTRSYIVIGTGHPIPAGATYVGTAPTWSGFLVWHLYQV